MNQFFIDQLARILVDQVKAEEENPVVYFVKRTLVFRKVIFIPVTCK